MEKEKRNSHAKSFMILGLVMAVLSVLIAYMVFVFDILPGACFLLEFITVPLVINGIAYLVYYLISKIKGNAQTIVLPLVCLVTAIISAVIGGISYVNDHSFVLRGLDAELIWFFISIPAFVLAIIHFVVSFITMSKSKSKHPEQVNTAP